jgi:ABC-type multidrug transport system ATPase subunit
MSYCQNCGNGIEENGAKFCPICGVDLQFWGGVVAPGNAGINAIALTHNPITIGRDETNDICLDHPAVSAFHAHLEWRESDATWFVVDEGSAKGTFVNYAQVPAGSAGFAIQPGSDLIWIAPYAFRLQKEGQAQSSYFEPAHLRLDTAGLVRTVKHESTGERVAILDLEETPLSFRPGEFIALVGGSGAGKSTLMKALLGLTVAQEGTVYVGGIPFITDGEAQRFEAMHTVVGYVPQDDVVHMALTPMEAMDTIARLRLSPDLTKEERLVFIEETLRTVELWEHRYKQIKKLSGGQRKRVNIALELLSQPRLLFLDEPTSGLDPGLDLSIMELLQDWATNPSDPRTIILVTHATENVTYCKYVAFMAPGGLLVYFGPPEQALAYFGVKRFAEIYRIVGAYPMPALVEEDDTGKMPASTRHLAQQFQHSSDFFHFVTARQLQPDDAAMFPAKAQFPKEGWGQRAKEGFWRQFWLLTSRYWKLIQRDRLNFVILLLQGFLVAGLLWGVSRPDIFQPKGIENAQTVLFIMACAAAWLGILNATKEIVKEQDIYARERRYGLGAFPYVLSKLLVLSLIGLVQIGTLLFIFSQKASFPESGVLATWSPLWGEWLVTLTLTLIAGISLGLFLSSSTKTMDAATAVMFVLLLIQVMFSGLFFADAAWADMLSWFTFSRWGLEGAGTSVNLNGLLRESLGATYQPDSAYTFSPLYLISRWGILVAYIVLFSLLATWQQARKS